MKAYAAFANEKRQTPRFDIHFPATLRLTNGMRINGNTENISSCGAFFQHRELAQLDNESSCILSIYIEKENYAEEIEIECVVKPRSTSGVGLEFKTMSTRDYINFVFLLSTTAPEQQLLLSELKNNHGIELLD